MGLAQTHRLHHGWDEQRRDGGKAVVGTKQHTHPVRTSVVGLAERVRRVEVNFRDRRRGVDPHGEQRHPREELHRRQLTHSRRHGVEVPQDAEEQAFPGGTALVSDARQTPHQTSRTQQEQLAVEVECINASQQRHTTGGPRKARARSVGRC